MSYPFNLIFPDVLGDLKPWLVNHPLLSPVIGGRVFFVTPDQTPTPPWIRIYRSGGGPDPLSDTPLDEVRVSHEVWGSDRTDRAAVRDVVSILKTVYFYANHLPLNPPSGSTWLLSAGVNSEVEADDIALGWPRIVVDAVLVVRLTTVL